MSTPQPIKKIKPDNLLSEAEAAFNKGDYQTSIEYLRKAIDQNPHSTFICNNLGLSLANCGYFEEAEIYYRRALELNPRFAEALNNLGILLIKQHRFSEARQCFEQAIAINPRFYQPINCLGTLNRYEQNFEEAERLYRKALELNDKCIELIINLSMLLNELGRHDEALAFCEHALSIQPDDPDILNTVGTILMDKKCDKQAEQVFKKALQIDPHNSNVLCNLGANYRNMDDIDKSIEYIEMSIQAEPGNASAHANLGGTLTYAGRISESIDSYRKALQLEPTLSQPYAKLAKSLKEKLPEDDIKTMKQLAETPTISIRNRASLYFGLAIVYDAMHQYAEAAEFAEKANHYAELMWQQIYCYKPEIFERFIDNNIRFFTPEYFENVKGWGSTSHVPVFIVGMPRSGTTLTEQILAAHPKVYGAGELKLIQKDVEQIQQVFKRKSVLECFNLASREVIRSLAGQHLRTLREYDPHAERIIDKMPYNYFHIGLIYTLFPNAKFIHCRRDLRDVAISTWLTDFEDVFWASSIRNITTRIEQYLRMTDRWQKVFPGRILEIDYERTVTDLEPVARQLIDFIGLEWDDACLNPHLVNRPIKTASVIQVRQPVYTNAINRWQNYIDLIPDLFRFNQHDWRHQQEQPLQNKVRVKNLSELGIVGSDLFINNQSITDKLSY